MDIYLHIAAWLMIGICTMNILVVPAIFGKSRGVYNYASFIEKLLDFAFIVPLALKVLGWI